MRSLFGHRRGLGDVRKRRLRQTHDLPNFHKVDEKVYRGAQPTDAGFRKLANMGVRTIIDLRGPEHSQSHEKQVVEAAGMRYVSIPMKGMTPTDGSPDFRGPQSDEQF